MYKKLFALLVAGAFSTSMFALVGDVVGTAAGVAKGAAAAGEATVGAATGAVPSAVEPVGETVATPAKETPLEEEEVTVEEIAPAPEKGKMPKGAAEVEMEEFELGKAPSAEMAAPAAPCPSKPSEEMGAEATPHDISGFEEEENV